MYKIKEVAKILKVSEKWLYEKIREGKIKPVNLGGNIRVSEDELNRIKTEGIE